jgi:hypothetical protein
MSSMLLSLVLCAAASNLDATDETLTATTTATTATDVTVNFVDFTTSSGANVGSGEQVTNFTTATTSTILAAPAASTTRVPSLVKACNKGAASQTVTVQYAKTAGGLSVRQFVGSLGPGECIAWGNDGSTVRTTSGGTPVTAGAPNLIGGRPYTWTKSATATDTAGYHYAFFKDTGMPGAFSVGTPGLNGVATDCSVVGTAGTGGALTIGAPLFTSAASGSLYLRSVQLTAAAIGTYQLIDVMWINTALVVTTTTAQTTTSPTLPARDVNGSTNGEGVEFALLTTTANTNAAAISNGSISYTDSDGNAGNTGPQFALVSFQTTISPVIGTWTPFHYAAGDRGIRALASVTLGTSYVAGALSAVLYRPIATVGVTVANTPTVLVPEISPRLYNGSCLAWVAIGNPATTAPAITAATIQVVER